MTTWDQALATEADALASVAQTRLFEMRCEMNLNTLSTNTLRHFELTSVIAKHLSDVRMARVMVRTVRTAVTSETYPGVRFVEYLELYTDELGFTSWRAAVKRAVRNNNVRHVHIVR